MILDLDILRSFVLAVDLGSFVAAADRVGRSPSAVSLQMRKLEEQIGQPLYWISGREIALIEAGETVLRYGRPILYLNDECIEASALIKIRGNIRIGIPKTSPKHGSPGSWDASAAPIQMSRSRSKWIDHRSCIDIWLKENSTSCSLIAPTIERTLRFCAFMI